MRRISIISVVLAIFLFAAVALPSVAAHADLNATVIVDVLNIRKAPRTSYPIVATAARGTTLNLVGRNSGGTWVQVTGGFGTGWVSSQFIAVLKGGQIGTLPVTDRSISPFVTIAVFPSVSVRFGPSVNYQVIGILVQGQAVDVIGQDPSSKWLQVATPFGVGWILSEYTNIVGNLSAAPNTDDQAPAVVKNVNYRLNIRSTPSTSGAVVGVLGYEAYAQIIGVSPNGKWWKITGSFGSGWVSASFVLAIGNLNNVPVVSG